MSFSNHPLPFTGEGKKERNMAEIIYFGTDGCPGHYPIGIDKTLTGTEYDIWRECDCDAWINNI